MSIILWNPVFSLPCCRNRSIFFFKNPYGHSASDYTEETKRILVNGQVFPFLPTVVSTSHMTRHSAQGTSHNWRLPLTFLWRECLSELRWRTTLGGINVKNSFCGTTTIKNKCQIQQNSFNPATDTPHISLQSRRWGKWSQDWKFHHQ